MFSSDEMHFCLGNYSVRFSRVELCLVTRFKFVKVPDTSKYESMEGRIHERYFGWYLHGLGRGNKVKVQLGQFDTPDDVDLTSFSDFPWGTLVYSYSIKSFVSALSGRATGFKSRQVQKGKEKHSKDKYNVYSYWDEHLCFQIQVCLGQKKNSRGRAMVFRQEFLILREAKGIGKISESDFQFSPMWIQLHNLPLACMSRDVGLFLGEMIGKVLKVDPGSSEDCLGKFIRVRALVDVGKRFRRMLRVIIGEPEVECVVILKFERIPNFCYFCRRVGHLVRECLDNVNSIVDESLLKFGSWMRAIGPSFNRSRGRESRTDTEDGSNRKENSDPNPIRKDDDACKPSPISSPLKNKNANRDMGVSSASKGVVDEGFKKPDERHDVDFGLSSGISLGSTVNDGGEVTSPRGRRWKCLARENVAILNTESSLS
ncbi:hypothetical protein JRO89_XS14G0122200 [Xanthoceras sorbifolium]|uniref:CCHC-type domain-containing protein n=1 Tax=Xanthoceras sorbifolium TaxID=99658 RepID=A0ABQ8H523_9ROSI|nr:hypothetical protein JRO89_XS14G0122200 [Xanthoceras sorbifolium]